VERPIACGKASTERVEMMALKIICLDDTMTDIPDWKVGYRKWDREEVGGGRG